MSTSQTMDIKKMLSEPREKLPDYLDKSQFDSETIIQIIKNIQSYPATKDERINVFTEKYSQFAEMYPVLFDMACAPNFDYEKFNYMMKIREQIANKNRTVEHASAEIGNIFYNMYHPQGSGSTKDTQ
jgi:hypothetical protein